MDIGRANFYGVQPLVKDRSPRGKINVESLYNSFSTVATELHNIRTKRNLTTMDIEVGAFESAEQRRKILFSTKNRKTN